MNKTKIVIALAVMAALTLVIVGLTSAQIAPSPTYAGATPNTAVPNDGFLGWMGNCFGLRNSQPYANQNIDPQDPPTTSSVPTPNQNRYCYGYGSCWAR